MQIVFDSSKVLQVIYNKLQETSSSLYIVIGMENMAKELSMSKQHLNLCIHYLIESGYLKGDSSFSTNVDSSKKVLLTPTAINYIENTKL